jgi:hypothetical protein
MKELVDFPAHTVDFCFENSLMCMNACKCGKILEYLIESCKVICLIFP